MDSDSTGPGRGCLSHKQHHQGMPMATHPGSHLERRGGPELLCAGLGAFSELLEDHDSWPVRTGVVGLLSGPQINEAQP